MLVFWVSYGLCWLWSMLVTVHVSYGICWLRSMLVVCIDQVRITYDLYQFSVLVTVCVSGPNLSLVGYGPSRGLSYGPS